MTTEAKSKVLVLDATAFYSGLPYAGLEIYKTTKQVLKEVSRGIKYQAIINTLLEAKRLEVEEPPVEVYQKVKEVALKTNDLPYLSEADLSILALALHYSRKCDATIVSDDYAVQNVAQTLNIPFLPTMSKGIKKMVKWVRYCPGCGKSYATNIRSCPICGTTLKRKFQSSKEINY
ncbi:MAG: hypothetical protein QXJ86_02595 [Nitrososphaerales archaeon]